jgi:chromate reductase
MKKLQVAVIVGSLRRESINRLLAKAITQLAPPSLEFHDVALEDLPMYNGDLEAQRPDSVVRFTADCARTDAMLVVMPEFNRSLPVVLKNAIDWGSKPMDKNVWRDKPIAIAGTSPGNIGTAVGQQHLRQVLGVLGASVLGGEAYITFKPNLITTDGEITDEGTRKFLQSYVDRFASFAAKLAAD